MKIRNLSLILCSLVVGVCCSCQTTKVVHIDIERREADQGKIRLVNALRELSAILYPNDDDEGLSEKDWSKIRETNDRRIDQVLGKIENASELATLALLSRTLSKHCLNMECFKTSRLRPTYENTYWKIVKRLALNKDSNQSMLNELKLQSRLEGTDLGDWERIVDGKPFP